MTAVTVVSSLTTISGCGTVYLGDVNVTDHSVGEIKEMIETATSISIPNQKLWWRGYILDNNSLPLIEACVGVNDGENISAELDVLIIFMTVDQPKTELSSSL